jgi:hypothetical protein
MRPDHLPELTGDVQRQMLAYFCDHFVVLGGSCIALDDQGKDTGEEQFFAFSGFVLSVRGEWCLVTAGHAIKDLEDLLRNRRIRPTNCCLADYFGSNPRSFESIPFDYEGAGKLFSDDEQAGLDFALIALRPLDRWNLEANGIRAISEADWIVFACPVRVFAGLVEARLQEYEQARQASGQPEGPTA